MKNIFYLISVVTILQSFVARGEVCLWFPKEIGVVENCEENEVSIKFDILSDSKNSIQIHNFKFSNQNYSLVVNGRQKNILDTLFLSEKKPLRIEIKFKRNLTTDQDKITFKTNEKNYLNNTIRIKYGAYYINSESIRDGAEQILNFTESCNDSLVVHFPFGGTVSGVSLYKDSTKFNSPIKSVSYGIMDEKNYLKFSYKEKGRYFVRFSSCHWGNEFWLTIK